MADIFWDRLEPHTRSENLEEGLQERMADSLWLLARQWQVGEFRGEDAASPIHARVHVTSTPIESFRNEAVKSSRPEPFPQNFPLEVRVEAEAVTTGPAALELAAESGLSLLRRLNAEKLGHLRPKLRERFALEVTPAHTSGLPERDVRRLNLLARRAVDGRKLFAATDAELDKLALSNADRTNLDRLLVTFRAEVSARFAEPVAGTSTWANERLEYSFSIAAAATKQDVVLSAPEYPGGHLDWYSFDVSPNATHGLAPRTLPSRPLELLPVPLSFAGMPASRWCEMEEGAVYFGGIEAGPSDLARMVVAEVATLYSDDFWMLPVRLPAGSLARISHIDVRDTFGGSHRVRSTAALDQAAVGVGRARPWAFFELSGDPSANAGETPWLLLAPNTASSLDSRPVERVSFVRDEAANLAWAIEELIETPTGRPLRRRLQAGLLDRPTAPASGDAWRYRLQTPVPPFWIPLVPEPIATGSSQIRLRRGRMLAWRDLESRGDRGARPHPDARARAAAVRGGDSRHRRGAHAGVAVRARRRRSSLRVDGPPQAPRPR